LKTASDILEAPGYSPKQLRDALFAPEENLRKFKCLTCEKEISSKLGYTNLIKTCC
jgi:hypothetical protein